MADIQKITGAEIENRIFTIRGVQVMIDRDLAELYQVEVKRLNEQVRRNIDRFPETFRFQLTVDEKDELVANCDRFESLKHSSSNPYAFTEQGIAMLSAVLRSDVAVKVSIQIMEAFVTIRKFMISNASIFQRLSHVELKQIQTDQKLDQIFKAIEGNQLNPKQGIFFKGQIFDAYAFVSDLIKSAKHSIVLIDNYMDESVLTLFTKRKKKVSVKIYTTKISQKLRLDVEKYNQQYDPVELKEFKDSHDRFLILDDEHLYHFGASLKDLGKKWFAFSQIDELTAAVLNKLK